MKTLFFNPFKRYRAGNLLSSGVIFMIIGSVLAGLFNTHFNGVLDIHSATDIKFWQPFAENAIDIAVLWFLLFLAGKFLNRKTRAIDILTTCMVARAPLYFTPLLNINNFMGRAGNQLMLDLSQQSTTSHPSLITILIVFGIIEVLAIIWYIALLYNGYKVAAHARGTRAVILFIVAVLISEIVSFFIFFHFNI